jgi:hypothetical protein
MFGKRDLATLLLATGLATGGCASVPAQIMSDTRQTIRAAEAAGAEQWAPEPLGQAREGLQRAAEFLRQREYREAKREAESARRSAAQALKTAEERRAESAPAPGQPPGP